MSFLGNIAMKYGDPNDAANQAQCLTDSMRMRRGVLANIYAGGSNMAPVTGKTQLGT